MNYETTLATVRSLSENATLRPAAKALLLGSRVQAAGPRPAITSYEEQHAQVIQGRQTAHGRRPDSRKPRWILIP